jgi:hypothetical protein
MSTFVSYRRTELLPLSLPSYGLCTMYIQISYIIIFTLYIRMHTHTHTKTHIFMFINMYIVYPYVYIVRLTAVYIHHYFCASKHILIYTAVGCQRSTNLLLPLGMYNTIFLHYV